MNNLDLLTVGFQDAIKPVIDPLIQKIENLEAIIKSYTPVKPKRFLTSQEVKEIYNIQDTTLWRWKKAGKIKFIKIGGRVLFPVED